MTQLLLNHSQSFLELVSVKINFQIYGRKSNICPIHKKGGKQVIDNHRPVSLLPSCGKVFERLVFNSVYEYLEEHKLLSADQSGFRANDSCVNQLLSIVHSIYSAFDAYSTLEIRSVLFEYVQGF